MRKKSVITAVVLVTLFTGCSRNPEYVGSLEQKPGVNVLMLMNDNFGLNYMLMLDNLELKGWKLTHIGTSSEITPCLGFQSKDIPPYRPEISLPDYSGGTDFDFSGYDAFLTMPGTGSFAPIKNPFGDIIDNPGTMQLVKNVYNAGMPFFAMCMGAVVPLEAGLIEGREVVCTSRLKQRIMMADGNFLGRDHPPVISDNLITGVRGQYYNDRNMAAVARAMEKFTGRRGKITAAAADWKTSARPSLPGVRDNPVNNSMRTADWNKLTVGSPQPDGARAGVLLSDGGMFLCGYSFGRRTENSDGVVLRTAADGSLLWAMYLGGPGSDYLNAAAEHSGILYTAGTTASEGKGAVDALAAAFSPEGELLWYRCFGGEADDEIIDITVSAAGPLLFGHTANNTEGEEDLLLVQLDFEGNEKWRRHIRRETFRNCRRNYAL